MYYYNLEKIEVLMKVYVILQIYQKINKLLYVIKIETALILKKLMIIGYEITKF